jgi:hypothetical protein
MFCHGRIMTRFKSSTVMRLYVDDTRKHSLQAERKRDKAGDAAK